MIAMSNKPITPLNNNKATSVLSPTITSFNDRIFAAALSPLSAAELAINFSFSIAPNCAVASDIETSFFKVPILLNALVITPQLLTSKP